MADKKKVTPAVNADIKKFLSNAKSAWAKDKKAAKKDSENQGSEIEDGNYNAQVIGCTLRKSAAGSPMIMWEYRIANGHRKGKKIVSFDMLDREKSLYYLAMKFIRLGFDPNIIEIDDIPEQLASIAEDKPYVAITTKTAAGQTLPNIYVNKVLEDYDEEDDDDFEEDEDDDSDDDDEEEDEDEEDEEEYSVGDKVSYGGKAHTIKKINSKSGKITLENKKGVSVVISPEELDDEE